MNKQIRQRTWKYFWEQKIKEIAKFLGWLILIAVGIFVIVIILYYLGKLSYLIIDFTCYTNSSIDCLLEYVFSGTLTLIILFIGGLFLWLIFYEGLYQVWIVPNWEKASKRAKKDFK